MPAEKPGPPTSAMMTDLFEVSWASLNDLSWRTSELSLGANEPGYQRGSVHLTTNDKNRRRNVALTARSSSSRQQEEADGTSPAMTPSKVFTGRNLL
jgi:hypothetical protein